MTPDGVVRSSRGVVASWYRRAWHVSPGSAAGHHRLMATHDDADDESGRPLESFEEQALWALGNRLRDEDPRLAQDLSSGRESLLGPGSGWRRPVAFALVALVVAVVSLALLVIVGAGGGVAIVAALTTVAVAAGRLRG